MSLLGPSGCGKSTALRLIADLLTPSRGRISWSGDHGQGDLGVVFQEPTLMPWATVAQNVYLPFRLRGKSYSSVRDDVLHALKLVGLEKFQSSYPRELSGGMKMRVSIARAMVTRPRLILMDEPFAGVDPIAVGDIRTLVSHLSERGIGVLITDHNVRETLEIVDRAYILN
ncbi:MAG: ATP-binding cassette domain-containing protein, partial [Pseudomonadota bacterium]